MAIKIHPSITTERIASALEDYELNCGNPGFCLTCGADADGCEPDAEFYECEECGSPEVFGAMQVAIMFA